MFDHYCQAGQAFWEKFENVAVTSKFLTELFGSYETGKEFSFLLLPPKTKLLSGGRAKVELIFVLQHVRIHALFQKLLFQKS